MRDAINLSDPVVRSMLEGGLGPVPQRRKDLVQIAGDAPDPSGLSSQRGLSSAYNLSASRREVVCVYRGVCGEIFMTVDVYIVPGEAPKVHLYCPRCHKHSTVSGDRKRIEFEPVAENPLRGAILEHAAHKGVPELAAAAHHGMLSVETFECTWEVGDARHTPGGVHTGATLCRMRLVIDSNSVRDA